MWCSEATCAPSPAGQPASCVIRRPPHSSGCCPLWSSMEAVEASEPSESGACLGVMGAGSCQGSATAHLPGVCLPWACSAVVFESSGFLSGPDCEGDPTWSSDAPVDEHSKVSGWGSLVPVSVAASRVVAWGSCMGTVSVSRADSSPLWVHTVCPCVDGPPALRSVCAHCHSASRAGQCSHQGCCQRESSATTSLEQPCSPGWLLCTLISRSGAA